MIKTRVRKTKDGKIVGEIYRAEFWEEVIQFSYPPWRGEWGIDTSRTIPVRFDHAKAVIEVYADALKMVEVEIKAADDAASEET